MGVQLNGKPAGQFYILCPGFKPHGQDNHVKNFFKKLAGFCQVFEFQVVVFIFFNRVNPGADKPYPFFIPGPKIIPVKIFAIGSHVHEKCGRIKGGKPGRKGDGIGLIGIPGCPQLSCRPWRAVFQKWWRCIPSGPYNAHWWAWQDRNPQWPFFHFSFREFQE